MSIAHHNPSPQHPIQVTPEGVSIGEAPPAGIAKEMSAAAISRRDFLKTSGLLAAGALMAGCTGKPKKVVPTVREEKGVKPGLHYWYSSTCAGCSAACGITAKVRDGRPIKLEGNPEHPLSQGGLCARGQGSLLSLYDADRLKTPMKGSAAISWSALYDQGRTALKAAQGDSIRLLTATPSGPSEARAIATFLEKWKGAKHVIADAVDYDAIIEAHFETHRVNALPSYNFDQAEMIVSFGADFMGTWLSPVEFARAWADGRRVDGGKQRLNRLVMVEAAMSLTGSNADTRYRVLDSQRGALMAALLQSVEKLAGKSPSGKTVSTEAISAAELSKMANQLWKAKGKSLVVCDSGLKDEQIIVNAINELLGNYGKTLSLATSSFIVTKSESSLADLIDDMAAGKVEVLITMGVNPAYSSSQGTAYSEAIQKVGTTIALSDRLDESAKLASFVGPIDHFLEGWNDHQPRKGLYSLTQPMVRRLFKSEAGGRVLLALAESLWGDRHWRAFVRDTWRTQILSVGGPRFEQCLETGLLDKRKQSAEPPYESTALSDEVIANVSKGVDSGLELVTYQSIAIGDGRHANNPWLQELPDPLTKATWDNFAVVSPKLLAELGAKEGDLVTVSAEGAESITLPLIAQPGQADGCVAIALGYGRSAAGRLAESLPEDTETLGANVYPLHRPEIVNVSLKLAGGSRSVARAQTHDSQEGRPLAIETNLAAYLSDRSAGTPEKHDYGSMWEELEHKGHYWGMAVDLNACNGCSGCIIGCQAENNIPVVGKEEVFNRRDMAWLRLDRYYSDDENPEDLSKVDSNPRVMHQPMMCQHCDHAPCETVCPVAATTHSEEGLNQQTYNRCVGTRYCANNCPTKVRRFNWFDYSHDDQTMNLVLNPDVTIRSRGVMEKCSLCVQRIYDAKLEAGREGRSFADGDFKTACQQSCPTNAIVVGDLNDPKSSVAKMRKSQRSYEVLGELNLHAGVQYLTRIRNTDKAGAEE